MRTLVVVCLAGAALFAAAPALAQDDGTTTGRFNTSPKVSCEPLSLVCMRGVFDGTRARSDVEISGVAIDPVTPGCRPVSAFLDVFVPREPSGGFVSMLTGTLCVSTRSTDEVNRYSITGALTVLSGFGRYEGASGSGDVTLRTHDDHTKARLELELTP
jgi:hypothetical protein